MACIVFYHYYGFVFVPVVVFLPQGKVEFGPVFSGCWLQVRSTIFGTGLNLPT
jgi:hypothetical protein